MSNVLTDGLLRGALEGATLEVRTAVAPPVTIDLTPDGARGPNALTRALQPTFIIRRDGLELARVSPAGEADEASWKRTLAVTTAIVLGVLLLSFMLTRKKG